MSGLGQGAPVNGNTPLLKRDEIEEKKFTENEKKLASVHSDSKWQAITDYFEERIRHYDEQLGGADTSKMTMEEVGQRYLVSNIIKQELAAIKNRVELIANEVKHERTTQSRRGDKSEAN